MITFSFHVCIKGDTSGLSYIIETTVPPAEGHLITLDNATYEVDYILHERGKTFVVVELVEETVLYVDAEGRLTRN